MGGFSLISPRNFLLFHHGTLFLHYLRKPHHFAVRAVQAFELWCDSVDLNLSVTHLPTLQMAVVQWSVLNISGLSCKAYSQLRSCLSVALNEHMIVGDIPLFHNIMFGNEHSQTYFSKKFVLEDLTTVGALDREPWKLGLFPPSFHASHLAPSQSMCEAQANQIESMGVVHIEHTAWVIFPFDCGCIEFLQQTATDSHQRYEKPSTNWLYRTL